jgi:hypothetical protein
VRIPMSFLVVAGAGLTWRERVLIAAAWTPKATVQAALGPLPLDTIRTSQVGRGVGAQVKGAKVLPCCVQTAGALC